MTEPATTPAPVPRCRWEITSRKIHQCHETARCPHLDDNPAFPCECIPRAREYEVARAAYVDSGAAARMVADTIKNVGKVA